MNVTIALRYAFQFSPRLVSWILAFSLTVISILPAIVTPSRVFAANDLFILTTGANTSVNESGTTDSFTVRLSDAPGSNVVISVTGGNTAEVTASPSSLTFTSSDWGTAQKVTVTGVDDSLADGDTVTQVALQVVDSQSDAAYSGKSASVSVTTVDNEESATPGIAVTEPDGETVVNESGTTDTFTVVLRTRPTANVTLSITSGNTNEVTVSPQQLPFTQGTWNNPLTVTVRGVDDTIPDGNQLTSLVISVVDAASAAEYQSVTDQSVMVTTVDNEVPMPGFLITESDGNTAVSETGTTDTFTVRLTKQPTAEVVMSVVSADTTEVTVSPNELRFNAATWLVPQTLTVTGVDDTLSDGNQVTPVVLSVVDSLSAAEYRAMPDQSVLVTTVDDEPPTPGFTVTQTGGNTVVNESGTQDTFTVVLNKKPDTNVVISVTSTDTTEVTVDRSQLTFTPDNWNTAQTVRVTGVDDTISDGDQTTAVVLSVVDSLSDVAYRNVLDQTVNVVTVDNEAPAPGFNVVESGGTTAVNESGTTDTFTVALTKQPTADVVVSVTSSDTTEVMFTSSELRFNQNNWNTPQTVEARGVDDGLADGDQVTDVVLSVVDSLSAVEYRDVASYRVQVTTVDNEPPVPGLQVTETGGSTSVDESGTTDTFTVTLTKEPTSAVVISVTSADTSEVTVSPGELTFTQGNWNSPRTVTAKGVDDTVNDGNQLTDVVLSVVDSLSAVEYRDVADRQVQVTTVDNDPRPGPILMSPPDGAQLNTLGPTLQWSQELNTNWFQVQVIPFNNDGPGVDLIIGDTLQVAAAQYQVMEPNFGSSSPNYVMLPGMTYTWRVRTSATVSTPTESDWTAWSTPRTFGTASKGSGTISRVSPAEGITVNSRTPTLVWSNSDKTVFYYEVQVSKDRNFGTAPGSPFLYWELRHGGLTNPSDSYTIPSQFPLERNTTYYWRARPRVQGNGTPVPWSSTFSFKTQ